MIQWFAKGPINNNWESFNYNSMVACITLPISIYSNIFVSLACDTGAERNALGCSLLSTDVLMVFAPYNSDIVNTNKWRFDLLILMF